MKNKTILLSILLLLVLCGGCSKNDPSLNATRLRISLTDAPLSTRATSISITEMIVDIQKIEVSMVDSTSSSENWVPLDFKGGEYNILPLSNGKSKQIVDQYFPSGILKQIKITFGDNSKFKTFSGEKNLILDPSAKEGVILTVNANLYANYVTNIMIDINAALSFYEQNDNFFFKPNLRVFPETYGGALKGYIQPIEANPQVIIINDKDTLMTLPEMKDGMFMFLGLDKGKWDIYVLTDPQMGYKDTIFSDSIFVGKTTELKSKIVLKKIKGDNDEGGEGA